MSKKLLFIISLSLLLTGSVKPAFAVSTPDFGSCLNPQVSASQVNVGNNHGVVGQSQTFSGTDTIYTLSAGNVLQCLCPDNGTGMQTNWYKVSQLSESDIESLKMDGWIYVPTGSTWGLSDDPYLAKNTEFSCKGSNSSSTSGSSSSSSSSSNSSSNNSQGSVLGLAGTGNETAIYGFVLAGTVCLIAGLLLNRAKRS